MTLVPARTWHLDSATVRSRPRKRTPPTTLLAVHHKFERDVLARARKCYAAMAHPLHARVGGQDNDMLPSWKYLSVLAAVCTFIQFDPTRKNLYVMISQPHLQNFSHKIWCSIVDIPLHGVIFTSVSTAVQLKLSHEKYNFVAIEKLHCAVYPEVSLTLLPKSTNTAKRTC